MKRIAAVIVSLLLIIPVSQCFIPAVAAGAPTITCESKECSQGDTVTIGVNVTNNPGITYLELTPTYSEQLGAPTINNGSLFSDFTVGKQLVWTADNDILANGKLVSLVFNIGEAVTPGNYTVGFIFRSAYNYNEAPVTFNIVTATVQVKKKHTHTAGTAVTENVNNPTCTVNGSYDEVVYCSSCGAELSREQRPILAEGHKNSEVWSKDGTNHWHVCTVCGDKIDIAKHTFVNDVCTVCGYKAVKVNFPDVNLKDWYGDAVSYAVSAGLMKGYGSGKFGTADGIQRQDFVVILSRLSGDDLSEYEGKPSFKDVPTNAYYATALAWAKAVGVSSGYANGKFGVGDKVTREQIVTFLYNYAKLKDFNTTVTEEQKATIRAQYSDFKDISGYAQEAAYWALSRGVISGKNIGGKKLIAPKANAQRCEVAAMFYNIEEKGIFAE